MSERANIEWEDGYPTDESLEAAEAYWKSPDRFTDGWKNEADSWIRDTLSETAQNCCASYHEASAENVVGEQVTHVHFSTGGWSGAESVIGLIERCFLLNMRMLQWRRGGHYIFEIEP